MKIIHTADVHLGSPMTGVANPAIRRVELVQSLQNIAAYADNNGAAAIIVAGDLFDDRFATSQTVHSVADIVAHSRAQWFVLKGNHGGSEPYALLGQLCPQIKFFGDDWRYYPLGNVVVCGRELGADDEAQWKNFHPDPTAYNIAVLHGDVDDPAYGFIDKAALSVGVNYVALGHRHTFAQHKFGKVRACYSGVPEPRGFDEGDSGGFVEIDTEADTVRYVPQSIRRIVHKRVDVTPIVSGVGLRDALVDAIADVSTANYLDLAFVGELQEGLPLELTAKQVLEHKFFALRVKDETHPRLDLAAIGNEVSLRGEFVSAAMGIEDEELRNDVLKMGLAALGGEELL